MKLLLLGLGVGVGWGSVNQAPRVPEASWWPLVGVALLALWLAYRIGLARRGASASASAVASARAEAVATATGGQAAVNLYVGQLPAGESAQRWADLDRAPWIVRPVDDAEHLALHGDSADGLDPVQAVELAREGRVPDEVG